MAGKPKRDVILSAAGELFLSRGFDQVTLDEVSKRAGVGKGTIYRYFKDKEDLYSQVILTGLDGFHERLERDIAGPGAFEKKLHATARALHGFGLRHHNLFRSLHAVKLRNMAGARELMRQIRRRRRRGLDAVASLVRQGCRDGVCRQDIPASSAAHLFMALAHSAMWARDDGNSRPVTPKQVVSVFLSGMRRR